MASFKAIDAVSRAVVALLRDHYRPDDFQNRPPEFRVCLAQDLPMEVGVSLFLYRIGTNEAIHTLPERPLPDGPCRPHPLAVDLHFLLTAWAGDASLQHAIAGWMMRVIEDHPLLAVPALDDQVFHPGESVQIVLASLTTEEILSIWEAVANHAYQISVPYVARNVQIESTDLSRPD
jgi:hypothetical protein